MNCRKNLPIVLLAVVAPLVLLVNAFPDGPFPKLTGGFSEETCASCHNSFALNEGRTSGGTLNIVGIPAQYEEGVTYPVRVVLGHPGQTRWGFEIAVRYMASGHQAGQLIPGDEHTQVRSSSGVQYLMHTETGTRAGQSDGPVEFAFRWIAPDPTEGPVLFNAAGNAGNNNDSATGDFIYTASAFSRPIHQTEESLPVVYSPETDSHRGSRRISEDSRVIHVGVPVDLHQGNLEFLIQHRFLGNLSDVGDAFGVDRGANINLEMGYALTDRITVSASRARFDKIVQLGGSLEVADSGPFRFALRGGVDGHDNFQNHYSPFLEVATQFDYKLARVYVVPVFAFNTRQDPVPPGSRDFLVHPESNHTISLGTGADFRLSRNFSLVGEYIPRVYGYGGFLNDRAAVSGGLKIRTRGHVFSLFITNSRVLNATTYGVNATSTDYGFGFNIYRKVGR